MQEQTDNTNPVRKKSEELEVRSVSALPATHMHARALLFMLNNHHAHTTTQHCHRYGNINLQQ